MDNFNGFEKEKVVVEIGSKLTTNFSKGSRKGNAPDPEEIMRKIRQQQEENKRSE